MRRGRRQRHGRESRTAEHKDGRKAGTDGNGDSREEPRTMGKAGPTGRKTETRVFYIKSFTPKKTKFMMRKILSLFAIASMLVATSCSNEEFFDSAKNGTEANVSFTAQLPEGLQTKVTTRAYGKGEKATQLTCAVYDADWVLLQDLGENKTLTNGKTTVDLRLVNGKTYNIVFWADSYESETGEDVAITFNKEDAKVNVDYDKITANSEKLDAFFSVEKITVSGYETRDVKLKRPFAQLNIGAKDWNAMAKNGVEITKTGITVADIYNTLDFKSGDVTGERTSVTFTPGELPCDDVFPAGEEYTYLSMNYLLVSMDKTSDNKVTISYDGAVNERTFESVPLQRNWRTNIFGNLLTSQSDWKVEIEENFDGTHLYSGYGSLDEIIENGVSEIWLTGDAEITADKVLTRDLTIHGNGYTLTVNGYAWKDNTGILTLDNVTVVDTESYDERGGWEYTNLEINKVNATNCTFKNGLMISGNSAFTTCSFTESNSNQYAVWVSGGNVDFNNCTFQGARGLKVHNQYHDYQNGYKGTIKVEDCKFFIGSKPGACFGLLQSSAKISITNSLFVCAAGDQDMYIYERDYDLGTITTSGNTIVMPFSADETSYTIPANVSTYAPLISMPGTADELISESVVIDGGGHTITSYVSGIGDCTDVDKYNDIVVNNMYNIVGADVTVNNLTLTGTMTNMTVGSYSLKGTNRDLSNVTLNNVTLTDIQSGPQWNYAAMVVFNKVTLNDCSVTGTTPCTEFVTEATQYPDYTSKPDNCVDVNFANLSTVTVNGGFYGTVRAQAQANVTIKAGTTIKVLTAETINANGGKLLIEAGANVVDLVIDQATYANRINVVIEEGAEIRSITLNGVPATAADVNAISSKLP